MVLTAIPITLIVVAYALGVRRRTWSSAWEADATVCVTMQGCGVALMSPWTAMAASEPLHRVFGFWNLQHLLGHLCMLVAASALIHHVLTRLADEQQMVVLFGSRVLDPLKLIFPALVMLFIADGSGYRADFLSAPVNTVWHALYWVLLLGTAAYLLCYGIRLLRVVRRDARSRPTVDVYLVAIAADVVGCVIQFTAMWLDVDMALPVWLCLCWGAAGFAYGATQSWRAKVGWFDSGHRPLDQQPHPGARS